MACEALSFKATPHVGLHNLSPSNSPLINQPPLVEKIQARAGFRYVRGKQGNAGTKGSSVCCCNSREQVRTRRRGGVNRDWGLGQSAPKNPQGGYPHPRKSQTFQAAVGSPGAPWRGQLDSPNTLPEVEIVTRDGVIRRNVRSSEDKSPVDDQSEHEREAAAEERFKSSANLAEGFARQQQEAARAQMGGKKQEVEDFSEGRSSGGLGSLDETEELDPVKARIAAMKKKALEYKAAKEAAAEGRKQGASVKGSDILKGSVSEGLDSGSEKPEEVDPIKTRLEAMKKKALDYKASKQSSSSFTQVSDSAPPLPEELPQEVPESSEGGIGPELVMLMSQRRRVEPSPYANVIKPLERPSEEDMPEVEILVGNEGAVNGPPSKRVLENEEDYKPKVPTWGVFPRPQNISQAYGGGRTLRPGEPLISEEEKVAANKKTMELINAYKKKVGIEMDADVKEKAEKALMSGERLMKRGALRESVVYFDQVIQDTPFRSEVHGEALLHKAVVWDSLGNSEAAKPLYEKLSQHPKAHIQKKAGQMLFGFAAADKLKFSKSTIKFHDPSVYQRYLERFSNGYNNTYTPSAEELEQSAKDAGKSQLFAIAMVGAPLILICALIASRGSV